MSKIKIFALGGLNENGKNMYVVDVDENIFVFDAGLKYPSGNMLGVDYIIPKFDYLIKNKKKIRAMDGDLVYGTFWSMEDDYTVEPYIRVAAGDYLDLCDKWGKDSALTAILLTIGHELTHYFQWINALELTPIGMERQATKYARYVLDDYAETRGHP